MLLLYGNQFGHRLVQDFTTWATREGGIHRRSRNHDWNIGGMLQRGLLRHTWLGIGLEVGCMIRRFVGVLQLGFGSVNLERTASEISFIRNFRANHLGSNLRLGAEA